MQFAKPCKHSINMAG